MQWHLSHTAYSANLGVVYSRMLDHAAFFLVLLYICAVGFSEVPD